MKNIILLDRDGIINKKKREGNYVSKWNEFIFINKNLKGLLLLQNQGYKFIIITNQAGIGKKILTKKKLQFIHNKMCEYFKVLGLKKLKIYFCPHHPNKNCNCRKPKPGLFYKASYKYKFMLSKTIYIGDDPRDCMAAFNSGCKSILINKQKKFFQINNKNKPLAIKNNVLESINVINKFYKQQQ